MKANTSLLLDDQVAEIQVSFNNRVKHKDRIKVVEARKAQQLFRQSWDNNSMEFQETFKVMLLNCNNQLLGIKTVSQGGISTTQVDMRILLAIILKSLATGVVLAHNHPSGNCLPSDSDMRLQRKVVERCEFFNINVLDHVILTTDAYYSFTQSQAYAYE